MKINQSSVAKVLLAFILPTAVLTVFLSGREEKHPMKYNPLTPGEERVILHKGTERPFSGKFNNHNAKGIYTCKRCDAPLYRWQDKFDAHCGWPAFDDEIPDAVKRVPDADGRRTEILCARCGGHLGHVFLGEKYTPKNTRHCVNSVSLDFVPLENTRRAIFAGGCFWGTEYHFQRARGVLLTTTGYTGGKLESPTSKQVAAGNTGHAEAVEVIYNPSVIDYEDLVTLFYEIHDPTQVNRQGPDIGEEYRSEIFYLDEHQEKIAHKVTEILRAKGYKVATRLTRASAFWEAEGRHQDYYLRKKEPPACHVYKKRF